MHLKEDTKINRWSAILGFYLECSFLKILEAVLFKKILAMLRMRPNFKETGSIRNVLLI